LKAVIALGQRFGGSPVQIASIAESERIPVKFLEAILLDLKGQGLLESRAGKRGGYQLRRPPSTVTLGSVVRILEGPLAPLPCASETAFRPCEECQDVENCSIRILMRQVRDAVAMVLDNLTLAELIHEVDGRRHRAPLNGGG
jgi:Rrf2 family protein